MTAPWVTSAAIRNGVSVSTTCFVTVIVFAFTSGLGFITASKTVKRSSVIGRLDESSVPLSAPLAILLLGLYRLVIWHGLEFQARRIVRRIPANDVDGTPIKGEHRAGGKDCGGGVERGQLSRRGV